VTRVVGELRRFVIERASNQCEYCLIGQAFIFLRFEIDHIFAEKHNGETSPENLCLSCPDCNVFKGSDVASVDPESGLVVPLFHPRRQNWDEHFRLEEARIIGTTPAGRVTAKLLRMNQEERLEERARLFAQGLYP